MMIGLLLVLGCGCFIKVATALGIFKIGLGLSDFASSVAVVALALVLSVWSLEAPLRSLGGTEALIEGRITSWANVEKAFRPQLTTQTDPAVLEKLRALSPPAGSAAPANTEPSFSSLMVGSTISQLKTAFEISLMIIIPFLVLDLLVTNLLMLLGITQLPTSVVSLPCKLLLFVAVGGWELFVQKLLGLAA